MSIRPEHLHAAQVGEDEIGFTASMRLGGEGGLRREGRKARREHGQKGRNGKS
jgi:hypothetical protein